DLRFNIFWTLRALTKFYFLRQRAVRKRCPSCCATGAPRPRRTKDGVTVMTVSVPAQKSRILSARRLVLLASVAGLGVTVLLGGAGLLPQPTTPALTSIAYAQGADRGMGLADIVDRVRPAVMSVRVKPAGGAKMMGFEGDLPFPPNSQMERFFRRFGLPEGTTPDEPRAPRNRLVTGQGSG